METEKNEGPAYAVAMSLRIWHPSILSGEMTKAIGLSPSLCNDVGAGRRTPTGQVLDGVYTETYWLYKFGFPTEPEIEDCITKALSMLSPKRDFLNRICSTGGRCELFIGMFLERNTGIELDRDLIRQVAEVGLALSFDVFVPDKVKKSGV